MINTYMTSFKELKDKIKQIQENQLIPNPSMLRVDVTPYELSRLMQAYRGEADLYSKVETNGVVMFYTDEEQKDFENYLRKKGVTFKDVKSKPSDLADS